MSYGRLTFLIIASCFCSSVLADQAMPETKPAEGVVKSPVVGDAPAAIPPGLVTTDGLSPDALSRLSELEQTCDRLLEQRSAMISERQTHVSTIESSARQIVSLNQANNALASQRSALSRDASKLRKSRDNAKNLIEQGTLQGQLNDVEIAAAKLSTQAANNSAEINRLTIARDASARELKRLNSELLRCWNELEPVRSARVDLFGAGSRHLRGDDATVRAQFERWLVKDTFWVEGYFWAGLSAFEMGDTDGAADLVERGKRTATETAAFLGRRATAGRLQALSGLVATRQSKQKLRGAEDLKSAVRMARLAKDEGDWMVFFLAGRVSMELDQNFSQAKTYLIRASELKDSPTVQLWQARVQTTAPPNTAERDMPAGLKSLRNLWAADGQNSWRAGVFLVEGLAANGEREEAVATWKQVRSTMPADQVRIISPGIEKQLAGDAAN